MKIEFKLQERFAGFAVTSADAGEHGWICQRELVGPMDPHLMDRLEKLHAALFLKIPGLPIPSQIDHIVITIAQDLSAIAYVNELQPREQVKVNRAIEAGEEIFVRDIDDIAAVELGIDIPANSGVIVVWSFGWKRSLFYDVTPLGPDKLARDYPLEAVLAQQRILLLGLPIGAPNGTSLLTRAEYMAQGVVRLEQLLRERCEEESKYQELLEQHPWMLGQIYSKVVWLARRCWSRPFRRR